MIKEQVWKIYIRILSTDYKIISWVETQIIFETRRSNFLAQNFKAKQVSFDPVATDIKSRSISRGTFCREQSSALDSEKELCCLWENTDFVHWKWNKLLLLLLCFIFIIKSTVHSPIARLNVFKCLVLLPLLICCRTAVLIIVPRAHDPSGLWQGSRAQRRAQLFGSQRTGQ